MVLHCCSRRALETLSFYILFGFGFTSVCLADQRPNVLLIFSDDQGMGDVSCYGGDIPTPNIDSIAADGVKFTQFYAASSICTPSRYGLLTGRFAHRSRDQLTGALMFMSASHRDRGIRNGEQTYVSELNEAGYSTHLVGKWHLGHGDKAFWPTAHGFDSFYGHTGGCVDFFTCRYGSIPDWYRNEKLIHPVGYATDLITKEALSILAQTAGSVERPAATDRSRVRRTPWYLHVSYNAPHFGKGWDALSGEPVNVMQPKPSDLVQVQVDGTQIRKDYAAKVIGMDRSIGQLLSALDRTGQSNNTIVIFMSDHGATQEYGGDNGGLRGAKATLFEGGIRVPCVVRWPKVIEAGTISNAVASALDWYPTLARVTGTKGSKSNLDGQLISIFENSKVSNEGANAHHVPIVWKTGSHSELNRKSWAAVRDGNWKWVHEPLKPPMLFDLSDDPNEEVDLSTSYPDVTKRLGQLAEDS